MKTTAQQIEAIAFLYLETGNKIQQRRFKVGLSQQELADAVGLSRGSIANIETGRQKMLLETFLKIADALQIKPMRLIG